MNELKLDGQSKDIVSDNISKLNEIFPEVITEDKIDFEKLQSILGKDIDESREKYSFTWPGKTQAIKESQKPLIKFWVYIISFPYNLFKALLYLSLNFLTKFINLTGFLVLFTIISIDLLAHPPRRTTLIFLSFGPIILIGIKDILKGRALLFILSNSSFILGDKFKGGNELDFCSSAISAPVPNGYNPYNWEATLSKVRLYSVLYTNISWGSNFSDKKCFWFIYISLFLRPKA